MTQMISSPVWQTLAAIIAVVSAVLTFVKKSRRPVVRAAGWVKHHTVDRVFVMRSDFERLRKELNELRNLQGALTITVQDGDRLSPTNLSRLVGGSMPTSPPTSEPDSKTAERLAELDTSIAAIKDDIEAFRTYVKTLHTAKGPDGTDYNMTMANVTADITGLRRLISVARDYMEKGDASINEQLVYATRLIGQLQARIEALEANQPQPKLRAPTSAEGTKAANGSADDLSLFG